MVQRAVEVRPGQSYLVDEVACCSVSHGEKFRPIMRWRCDGQLFALPPKALHHPPGCRIWDDLC